MFSPSYMQTDQNTMGWIWFLILGILLLLVILWWLNGRRGEPSTPLEAPTADDLTRIEGIGPKVASVLNESGIAAFADLAQADPAELQKTLDAAGLQMMSPEGWIEQAALAAKGDWEALERLQSELKGGRKT